MAETHLLSMQDNNTTKDTCGHMKFDIVKGSPRDRISGGGQVQKR